MSTGHMSENNDKKKLSSHFQYQQIMIDENKYLLGIRKINESRQILLTDLTDFYSETLSKEDSMKRVEELNALLPDCDIDKIIDDLLLNIPKYTTSCTLQCIKLEYKIEEGRFWFHVKLTKADPKEYLEQQTENLYSTLSELHYRYNYLLDLVKSKDREIDEYKSQGVSIMKKSSMTEPFDEKLFETKKRKTRSVEKMAVFLETADFLSSINLSHAKEDSGKNECLVGETETIARVSNMLPKNKKTAVKRIPSSNIRCATIPKVGKKIKQSFSKQI